MFNSGNLGNIGDELLKKKGLIKTVCVILVIVIFFVISLMDKLDEKPDFFSEEEDVITKQEAKEILDKYVYESYADLFKIGFSSSYKTALAISNTDFVKNANLKCSDLYGDSLNKWPGSNESDNAYSVNDLLCRDNNIKFYSYEDVEKTYSSLYDDSSLPLKDKVSINFAAIYGYSDLKKGYSNLSCECGGISVKSLVSIYEAKENDDELYMLVGYLEYDLDDNKDNMVFNTDEGKILDIKTDYSENDLKTESNVDKLFEENEDVIPKYEIIFSIKDSEYIFKSFKKNN